MRGRGRPGAGEPGARRERAAGIASLSSRSLPYAQNIHPFDFRRPVAYDPAAKRLFHSRARSQLRCLATALGLPPGSYDLRSNPAGIAVSGEITLHTEAAKWAAVIKATGLTAE